MRALVLIVTLVTIACPSMASEKLWVTTQYLNRRTCPSTTCGIVGRLLHGEGVVILERKSGWGRVSKYYDASCVNGRSEYVDSGSPNCSESNGIHQGKFAEWIYLKYLAQHRPQRPSGDKTGLEKALSGSDHYARFRVTFLNSARKLISSGRCTLGDFKNMGGWVKSTSNYRNQPVYFTYCGGMTRANRIYLNAATGRIFQ
jgi:hypothetical protein